MTMGCDGDKILVSISGGKDSLAALVTHIESGGRCDGAVYCRIMFDRDTSAELPEHEEWLHEKCFPTLQREYGVKVKVVQGPYTYEECFYQRFERGSRKGRIYGFPFLRGPWCINRLKVGPLEAFKKTLGDPIGLVGIAADEKKRIQRKTVSGKLLPLVERGITEAEAAEICRRRGLLSPAYSGGRTRLGCWFCHNQRIGQLRRLYFEYPQLWAKLAALDKVSPVTFKPGRTLADFERRFSTEGQQMGLLEE